MGDELSENSEDRTVERSTSPVGPSATAVQVRERATTTVEIAALVPADSPRRGGPDAEHVARLAEVEGPLPPIVVDRRTMRVIDGMHRLLAAALSGREHIEVDFFHGSTEEAFLHAVTANTTHGLPLTQEDRRVAAARIIASHPAMSDRAIARSSGLGAKSVAAVRRELAPTVPPVASRIGRDGKVRPVDSGEGRRRAAELLASEPEMSMRQVARTVGISPATVMSVRNEMQADVRRRSPEGATDEAAALTRLPQARAVVPPARDRVPPDVTGVMESLKRDPSLRFKENGRRLLRLLQGNAGGRHVQELASVVPTHCSKAVADLAKHYATMWLSLAQELDDAHTRSGADAVVGRQAGVH